MSHKLARTLHERGCRVTLLASEAPRPSYLDMSVVRARAPFGSVLRPILNLPTLLQQALALRADLYLACNPDTLVLAIALAALGERVIYDTAEDFAQRPYIHPAVPRLLAPLVAKSLEAGERLLTRLAVGVCVTQEPIRARRGNCLLLANAPLTRGPVVAEAERIFASIARPACDLCLVYAGLLTELRGLWRMLDLVARLNDHLQVRLVLAGEFHPAGLLGAAERHPGWKFVHYQGQVSHAEALAWIRCSDLGLALLERVADYPTSSITKIYEYMQYGTPFVASDFQAWRASINDVAAGLFVEPADLDGAVAGILALARDPGRLERMRDVGRNFIHEHFNWHVVSKPFVELVDSAIAGRGR
ncbi:MAG TPA: glycosyltransferase [Burkholderiales bacterium]|nr:glycosyltransferase [Burkholderiales bacterium]